MEKVSRQWGIVLHGGCSNSYPSVEIQKDIENKLTELLQEATSFLEGGATATAVVLKLITALEDCPLFNAGRGSAFTQDGDHELEASLTEGKTGSYGAVACVGSTKNPILTANALLQQGNHCMLAGQAADDVSKRLGFEIVSNDYFSTARRRAHLEAVIRKKVKGTDWEPETVGAIVLDRYGNITAGGSTGGITGKARGRVGDTAILGAGLFANSNIGIVCGAGDEIFRQLLSSQIAKYYSNGLDVKTAASRAVTEMAHSGKPCAVAIVDEEGKFTIESTSRVFSVAAVSSDQSSWAGHHEATIKLLPQHIFFQDHQFKAGLSHFPTTPGHCLVILNSLSNFFALEKGEFKEVLYSIRKIEQKLCTHYRVTRCALITEGCNVVSIIPLYGVSAEWKPVVNLSKEFHETFPGYVTSKDGPKMDAEKLNQLACLIRGISGLKEPFDYTFQGEKDDNNLFARLIKGELPQWRIWETTEHVAFLTPFGNTPGFTVLVPRKHLTSDIFRVDDEDYSALMHAVHSVAKILMESFKTSRCGMIFEGFEIDYAHVKLIPILETEGSRKPLFIEAPFQETYQGYITSLSGPIYHDLDALSCDSVALQKLFHDKRSISAPQSWLSPIAHTKVVLQKQWYTNLFIVQDGLFYSSVRFFNDQLKYKYSFVPTTTDAISSPMGLGSDSCPVPITLFGRETHLADSMQFALEYFLRIKDNMPGVYYVNNSFRGEDPDEMHLNQFYHVECELIGGFEDGISIAERYLSNAVTDLLRCYSEPIRALAGNLDHLQAFLELYKSSGKRLPQITVSEALALPQIDGSCWKYVVPNQPRSGRSITRIGERKLIEHFGGAVWLKEMDHLSVPFYQAYTKNSMGEKALCADLLLGNGEVLGLGQRHEHASEVLAALRQHEVSTEPYEWYLEMRNAKPIQTTGWGMGVERFLAWVFQHDDIRDLSIIPRLKGSSFAP